MSKATEVLQAAQRLAASAETWADLSNALFDPVDGIVTKAYPTRRNGLRFSHRRSTSRSANLSTML